MKKSRKLKAQRDLFSCKGRPLKRMCKMVFLTVLSLFLSQTAILAKKSDPLQTQTSDRQIILADNERTADIASQQSFSISGKVTDISGSPLPGVTVSVKGTTSGSLTDAEGKYAISNVSSGTILVFSFMGMKLQEITVTGKTIIDVIMIEDSISLQEVVVVGYGSMNKKEISSSIVSVNKESYFRPYGITCW
jgi:hypothetical protein